MTSPKDAVSLAEWRRTVAELYAEVRAIAAAEPQRACEVFRAGRDRLFREHRDSPVPVGARSRWSGTSWFDYQPAWRTFGVVQALERASTFEIPLAQDGIARCTRVGSVAFTLLGKDVALTLYWFEGYGGGLWLPFGDWTNGVSTYGGGRYLYDTIKGADLGVA